MDFWMITVRADFGRNTKIGYFHTTLSQIKHSYFIKEWF